MIVPEYELQGHEYLSIDVLGQVASLVVFASGPVNLYLVDEPNLRRYQAGEPFQHHGPGQVRMFSSLIQLPGPGPWHALLENASNGAVRVAAKVG